MTHELNRAVGPEAYASGVSEAGPLLPSDQTRRKLNFLKSWGVFLVITSVIWPSCQPYVSHRIATGEALAERVVLDERAVLELKSRAVGQGIAAAGRPKRRHVAWQAVSLFGWR